MTEQPFLSIVTRHLCSRPVSLSLLERSLARQRDRDYEHIVLPDDFGIGIAEANKMFWHHRDTPRGRYLYMLDDDNLLTDLGFVEKLKRLVAKNNPDVVMFKIRRPGGAGYLPDDAHWQKPPARRHIGTSCFVVKRELWRKYIWAFGWRENGASVGRPGDYFFLKALWREHPRVYWHDEIVGEEMRVGEGRPEPDELEMANDNGDDNDTDSDDGPPAGNADRGSGGGQVGGPARGG